MKRRKERQKKVKQKERKRKKDRNSKKKAPKYPHNLSAYQSLTSNKLPRDCSLKLDIASFLNS